VITIAVAGIMAGVFVHYVGEGTAMLTQVDTRRVLTADARQALLRTLREVRQVRSATDIIVATPTRMSFRSVDDSLYTIAWNGVPGSDLSFSRGPVTVTLTTAVDSLAFAYTKSDGTLAAPIVSPSSTDIHRVSVYLRLREGNDAITVKTATYLRNVP